MTISFLSGWIACVPRMKSIHLIVMLRGLFVLERCFCIIYANEWCFFWNYTRDHVNQYMTFQYTWFYQDKFSFYTDLKALFNNDFTLNFLSCMSLHAISVFDKVYKWSPEKLHLKSTIKCFKEVKVDKWSDLSY